MENQNFNPDNGKTVAIISYFTIVGWLIAYFAMHKDNRTELGAYHLRQTLLFAIVSMIISWGLSFLLGIIAYTTGSISIMFLIYPMYFILFILWIIGLIGAINGEKKPIPLIGEKAQNLFASI